MNKIIKLTEVDLKRIIKKVISEDTGMDTPGGNPDYFYGDGSLDKIRKQYGDSDELEWISSDEMDELEKDADVEEINLESSIADKIYQLFDHKIAEWSMSPDHRVTKETNNYLDEWKENAKNQINDILSQVDYTEQELPENSRTLGGGDETKGGLPKQRGSKHPAMKIK